MTAFLKALATATQLTVETSTVIFEAATAHSKALIAAAKKVDEEVNRQVEVDDDEQSNSSDSEVSDEDVGMDIGNVVQSIEQSFQYKHDKMSRQSLDYIKLKLHFINIVDNAA